MFITLLVVTFLIAFAVSYIVARLFTNPLNNILSRIIADDISIVWLKYLKFAIYVIGISAGVRIGQLEKYITRPSEEYAEIVTLNLDRWFMEVYRTIIGALQGIAWMLLVFFVFALIAYVIVRISEARRETT
ncbi:hypothetical protein ACFL6I_01735 [candidate division KSB1 bacterium]